MCFKIVLQLSELRTEESSVQLRGPLPLVILLAGGMEGSFKTPSILSSSLSVVRIHLLCNHREGLLGAAGKMSVLF